MKNTLLCFLVMLFTANTISFADELERAVAIEFQVQAPAKFPGIIGKALIMDNSIDIVTFSQYSKDSNRTSVNAWIYKIFEKNSRFKGIYHIKCRNQLGVIASGTIDTQTEKPKITLITDSGYIITNISNEGMKLKQKLIPNVDIGEH